MNFASSLSVLSGSLKMLSVSLSVFSCSLFVLSVLSGSLALLSVSIFFFVSQSVCFAVGRPLDWLYVLSCSLSDLSDSLPFFIW